MKIFHVLHGFAPEFTGGTERTVEALARAMQRDGHEVTVVCGSIEPASSHRVDELDVDGLRVLRLHRSDLYYEDWLKAWSPELGRKFAALCRAEQPDVVHVHHWLRLSSDLARIARRNGAAVAVTMHDYFSTCATPMRRHGEVPEPPACSGIVGRDEQREAFADHRDDFADELCAAHLRYAPCRAHADGLAATAPRELGEIGIARPPLLDVPARLPEEPARQQRLVTWGSLYPEKGLDLVLDALFSIGSGWSLDVWGEAHDPDYGNRIETKAENMPVTFHGAFTIADFGKLEADYAVLPSMCEESYGLTLDEAQCLGLPVIAADLPAYRERAFAPGTAFFKPGDAGHLAQVLADQDALAALERPPSPEVESAAAAAAKLLADYASVDRSVAPPTGEMLPGRRARAMWRRAERRYWSALQGEPKAPPDRLLD